jgi:hypothetical protein
MNRMPTPWFEEQRYRRALMRIGRGAVRRRSATSSARRAIRMNGRAMSSIMSCKQWSPWPAHRNTAVPELSDKVRRRSGYLNLGALAPGRPAEICANPPACPSIRSMSQGPSLSRQIAKATRKITPAFISLPRFSLPNGNMRQTPEYRHYEPGFRGRMNAARKRTAFRSTTDPRTS